MSIEIIEKAQALLQGLTLGEWHEDSLEKGEEGFRPVIVAWGGNVVCEFDQEDSNPQDRKFIAAAPYLVSDLILEVRRSDYELRATQEENERLRRENEQLRADHAASHRARLNHYE